MSIIGINVKERQKNQIKKELELEGIKVELVSITPKSIENIKKVKFKILIIQNSLEELKENQELIREILKNVNYLILNTDININEEIFKDINLQILTYGLRQKATITVSSIEENKIMISIQRAFKGMNGKEIGQQEIPLKIVGRNTKNLYNSLIKTAIINIIDAKKC